MDHIVVILVEISYKLEIPGEAVQRIHQNSEKMVAFMRNCLVKINLRLFLLLSIFMTMVPPLLRQFKKLLQIKKFIKNAACVLYFAEKPKYVNK